MKSGPVGDPKRLGHRGDKGWESPRDDKSEDARSKDDPPRGTIGSNVEEFRSKR